MTPEPRRTGLVKFAHKLRNIRSGNAARALGRTTARLRGRELAHFLHVRKAGGTAIKDALKPHATAGRFHLSFHPHRITLNDIRTGEKVFFVVRDPIDRLVSGFLSRQRRGAPANHIPWTDEEAWAFDRFDSPEALGLALASTDDEARADADRALAGVIHVNSSYWDWFIDEPTLRARARDVLFIAHQERLAEDFAHLARILGLKAHAELPSDPSRAHRAPAYENRALSDTAREALHARLAPEYAFLDLCAELFGDDLDAFRTDHPPA